tara:strand:- start:2809 stop:3207 length:399 start_codon:yes stop_codon:yes gene_type:complete
VLLKIAFDIKKLRAFGLMLALLVPIIFIFFVPWIAGGVSPRWPWAFSGICIGIALLWPKGLFPVYKGWIRIGMVMSKITTPIILSVIFYVLFMPMGLLMRPFRDVLGLRKLRSKATYRVLPKPTNSNMENPF